MLKPSLQLRLGQQLTMTPQLQQAIRLLQLHALDLQQVIREALEQNVMLEADDDGDGGAVPEPAGDTVEAGSLTPTEAAAASGEAPAAPAESGSADDGWDEGLTAASPDAPWSGDDRTQEFSAQRGETLQEHLAWQLEMARLGQRELAIGRALIDAINDDGYLVDSVADIRAVLATEIEVTAAEVERVLCVVQAFDPVGVGARSVAECLGLQLAQLAPETPALAPALAIARVHLDLVAEQKFALLRRTLAVDEDQLAQALALVRACHPRPGSTIQPSQPDYIVPDVFVRRAAQGWTAELNPGALPRVRLNQAYASIVTRAADHAVLRTQLQEARWLLRSLEIRNDTLLRVARCIVERQAAFLDHGEESMEPMVLRDVAEAVDMHESTISRVTTGKYMHTPRGVIDFRYFFSSHVAAVDGTEMSSIAIHAKIRKLIKSEDPATPLSDNRIAELLAADGAQVARRTVAKYREELRIPPSSERRRAAGR